jgi:hypothetical protein
MEALLADKQTVSEIFRCPAILLIRLDSVQLGPWRADSDPVPTRTATLQIAIEDVLKGEIRQAVGARVPLQVTQRGGRVVMDYYGLWSHVPLTPGARFVAFCDGSTEDAALLLKGDEHCEQLLPAEKALADTRAAIELEKRNAAADQILSQAETQAPERGDLFARFVWASVQMEVMANRASFDRLLRIIETPRTNPGARDTYVRLLYEDLSVTDPARRARDMALIRTMLKLLIIPEASSSGDAIRRKYLPNMLGLSKGVERYSAEDVFKGHEALRAELLDKLRGQRDLAGLLVWLERKGS